MDHSLVFQCFSSHVTSGWDVGLGRRAGTGVGLASGWDGRLSCP